MGEAPVETAEGAAFRRRSLAERLGAAAGRFFPGGVVRDGVRSLYHRLLARGGGLVATLPEGETVRVLPRYRHLGWNPVEYAAFRAAVRPGAVVLDVGANVGAYALLFGRWAGPGGRVYAFEPAGEAFRGLAAHVALNALEEVVRPVHAAVSDRGGRAVLAGAGGQGTARLGEGNQGGEPVETVTIDAFCAAEGVTPSVVKVDVEGWELEALRGARETIRRAGDALALFVEMHPTAWRERGMDPAEVRAELARQGLAAEPLRPAADPWALEGECVRLRRVR